MKHYLIGIPNSKRYEFSTYCLMHELNYYNIDSTPFPITALYKVTAEEKDLTALKLAFPCKIKIFDGVEYAG